MKRLAIFPVVAAMLAALAMNLPAQNRDAYGVWVRGGKYDLKEFPFKGVEVDAKWSEVEPSDGVVRHPPQFDALLRVTPGLPTTPATPSQSTATTNFIGRSPWQSEAGLWG